LISFNIYSIDILIPKAPPSLGIIKAISEMDDFNTVYYNDAMVEVIPNIVKNKDYIYVIPVNLGAKLYEKNQNLQLIGVLSEGLLSIVSSEDYSSIIELDKKNIYIGAQGSSPDVISRYIFKMKNINPTINYRSSQEIAKLMIRDKATIAVLPEPLATFTLDKNKKLKRIFMLKSVWEEINGNVGIPQVGIFASQDFIKKHKNEIEKLIKNCEESINWIHSNQEKSANLAIDIFNMDIDKENMWDSITNMNLVFIRGKKAKESVEKYLNSLKEIDSHIIKELPNEEFYRE
jgi:NitT/TauT family transport system substrate-binding protein